MVSFGFATRTSRVITSLTRMFTTPIDAIWRPIRPGKGAPREPTSSADRPPRPWLHEFRNLPGSQALANLTGDEPGPLRRKESQMNWNQIEGNWEQFKGK